MPTPPPSEPGWRISRTWLSSRWSLTNRCMGLLQAEQPMVAKKSPLWQWQPRIPSRCRMIVLDSPVNMRQHMVRTTRTKRHVDDEPGRLSARRRPPNARRLVACWRLVARYADRAAVDSGAPDDFEDSPLSAGDASHDGRRQRASGPRALRHSGGDEWTRRFLVRRSSCKVGEIDRDSRVTLAYQDLEADTWAVWSILSTTGRRCEACGRTRGRTVPRGICRCQHDRGLRRDRRGESRASRLAMDAR